ncbi:hypothetical protein [Paraburkholderia ultramafica]|uniref:hypothetical protein n=1 Tax=Paraburkholderia ultramafica TaxID=1544867 RepID=UPI001582C035|nr:hypothetical protein [Paraburkholderia ultramafica]
MRTQSLTKRYVLNSIRRQYSDGQAIAVRAAIETAAIDAQRSVHVIRELETRALRDVAAFIGDAQRISDFSYIHAQITEQCISK